MSKTIWNIAEQSVTVQRDQNIKVMAVITHMLMTGMTKTNIRDGFKASFDYSVNAYIKPCEIATTRLSLPEGTLIQQVAFIQDTLTTIGQTRANDIGQVHVTAALIRDALTQAPTPWTKAKDKVNEYVLQGQSAYEQLDGQGTEQAAVLATAQSKLSTAKKNKALDKIPALLKDIAKAHKELLEMKQKQDAKQVDPLETDQFNAVKAYIQGLSDREALNGLIETAMGQLTVIEQAEQKQAA